MQGDSGTQAAPLAQQIADPAKPSAGAQVAQAEIPAPTCEADGSDHPGGSAASEQHPTAAPKPPVGRRGKHDNAPLRDIGHVSSELGISQHVLRYWEDKFSALRPRRVGGGRRRYSAKDVALLKGLKYLLHDLHLTIDGAQKVLREEGVDAIRFSGTAQVDPKLLKQLLRIRANLLTARTHLVDD